MAANTKPNSNRARQKIVRGKPHYAYANGQAPEGEVNTNHEVYVTARGHEVIFSPMPPMLKELIESSLQAEWPKPTAPTYEVKTVTGEVEVHYHTEKSLSTDEEREAWTVYKTELRQWEAEAWSRLLRALQIECIRFEEKEGWEKRHRYLKLNIPEDEFDRKLHYIQTEIIGDPEDIVACFTIPLRLTGVPDQQLEAVENSFRTLLRKTGTRQTTKAATRKQVEVQESPDGQAVQPA